MRAFKAIAAMSLNRVIGAGNKIPWHLPEDFKWFKRITTGHILVMGRKTFESIGKPLPNRTTFVLTRSSQVISGVETIADPAEIRARLPENDQREIFICGGAQVYEHTLSLCSDLYLTLVKRTVEGDAFFPIFEDQFTLKETIKQNPEFEIRHYVNNRRLGTER
jgi:dihydrofolate reductase